MTPRLSSATLRRLKNAQEEAMDDLCHIYHVTFTAGTYSDDETYITTGTLSVPCGIKFNDGRYSQMRDNPQLLVLDYDVMLRVSADIEIRKDDDIVLVEKGEFLVSGTFQPSSQPTFNSTVQHVPLKRKVV